MRVITKNPVFTEDFSNLNGDSPKDQILAFQNWAVSKGYIPNDKANSKWNVDTDKAYDTYGTQYESQKSVGGFRFDLQPNIASLKPKDKYEEQLKSGATLPELKATAIRPVSEGKKPNYLIWALYGLGLIALGYGAYKIVKSKNK